jgi:hypothetical protein
MAIATDLPSISRFGQVVRIGSGPLAGLSGRFVSECDRRWIIELLPGVLVSMAAVNCEAIFADDDYIAEA